MWCPEAAEPHSRLSALAFPSAAMLEQSAALPFFLSFAAFLCAPQPPCNRLTSSAEKQALCFPLECFFDKGKSSFCISALPLPFSVDSPLGRVLSRSLSPVQVPFEANIFFVHSNNIFSIFCLIVYVKCCFSLNIVSSIVFLFFLQFVEFALFSGFFPCLDRLFFFQTKKAFFRLLKATAFLFFFL